jgi:hypothetical protein
MFLYSQNTPTLLVKAIEELPDERTAVSQCVKIKNLDQINSERLDYRPVLYQNGIVFTSNRKSEGRNFLNRIFSRKPSNLYFAEKIKEGTYQAPVALPLQFRGKINEGAVAFDDSGSFMVYAVEDPKNSGYRSFTPMKLYASTFENGKWSKGKEIPVNFNNYSTCHPNLSADGKTLYFASNRPGGFGGMDIYFSELVNGEWQKPINLGSQINTSKNEVFPFFGQDRTLYFSSNGKAEAENLDIYFSRKSSSGEWKEAENMGKPFNSAADDFGFMVERDGLSGLFTSDREG